MKILIDPGHGGMSVENGYTTPGKRSPKGNDGVIYEGISNRAFAYNICYRLSLLGIKAEVLNADTKDVPLTQRVKRINDMVSSAPKDYLLVSIHSNAAPTPSSNSPFVSATGIEIYTSANAPAYTVGIAHKIAKSLITDLPTVVWRYGNNWALHKEQNFEIIKRTRCPAVLLEVLFMNGVSDYGLLTSPEWRVKFESALVNAIYATCNTI